MVKWFKVNMNKINVANLKNITLNDDHGNLMISCDGSTLNITDGGSIDINFVSNKEISISGQSLICGKPIKSITIDGDVNISDIDFPNIVINGSVGSVHTSSGDITISGDVSGSVSTMSGDVSIKGNVAGSISTMSGDVDVRSLS